MSSVMSRAPPTFVDGPESTETEGFGVGGAVTGGATGGGETIGAVCVIVACGGGVTIGALYDVAGGGAAGGVAGFTEYDGDEYVCTGATGAGGAITAGSGALIDSTGSSSNDAM